MSFPPRLTARRGRLQRESIIRARAGTQHQVTLFNCFVMGQIVNSMSGIFYHLKEAALTLQQGGGINYDFSTLRPRGALAEKIPPDLPFFQSARHL